MFQEKTTELFKKSIENVLFLLFLLCFCFPVHKIYSQNTQWNVSRGFDWLIEGTVLRIKENSDYSYGSYIYADSMHSIYPWDDYRLMIQKIIIEEGTNYIPAGAFRAFSNLESVIIPNSVTAINDYAFHLCLSLKTVKMSNLLRVIGEGAFSDCVSLTKIELPNHLYSIQKNAFHQCTGITSVLIPKSVTYIGTDAFEKYTVIFTYKNTVAAQWAEKNSRKVKFVKEKNFAGPYEMGIEIYNLHRDGTRGIPNDLDDVFFSITIELWNGKFYSSDLMNLSVEKMKKGKTFGLLTFQEELPNVGRNNCYVFIPDLPKYIYGNYPEKHKYFLSYYSWVNKNGNVELYLIWSDENIFTDTNNQTNSSYRWWQYTQPLPEDEIGAYKLNPDGTKEYLIFQTYDVCMHYLGSEDLCSGNERCYHK
ncbi:MAG: leucine-rich repeat domain-containing protein [Anaerolineaceae bacterium]|nr:leucine-rich repeat domain-containing protein [Anaerolineaceae bacterium]